MNCEQAMSTGVAPNRHRAAAPSRLRARAKAVLLTLALLALLWPGDAAACAVCYGEPDSPAAQGLTWAIVALGFVVATVLSGVVVFFVQANRKSSQVEAENFKTGDFR
jgi:heme/copper-type cytochrome/quinol oxidase subunit 2